MTLLLLINARAQFVSADQKAFGHCVPGSDTPTPQFSSGSPRGSLPSLHCFLVEEQS